MKKLAIAFVAGLLFAVGLGVSGMTHPTKVLAFLDVAADGTAGQERWDPSLAFVMGAGVLVNLVGFHLARRRGRPWLAAEFSLPRQTRVDGALVGGAALFGVGWGLGGFCPGPALVAVVGGAAPTVAFAVAMLATMALLDLGRARRSVSAAAATPTPTTRAAADPS